MGGTIAVVDPDGVRWQIRRRWYAWRRWVTVGDLWRATSGGTDANGTEDDVGCILALPLLVIGLAASLIDLTAQLAVLPFVVLARLVRLMTWPVQLDREHTHFRTLRVKGFGAAGRLRDEAAAQVRDGSLPGRPLPEPPTPAT